jgi:hypothetical protein
VFFEVRKRQDLYIWLGKAPDGPCAKFLVQNVHTMDELKLTGNHLKVGAGGQAGGRCSAGGRPHAAWRAMRARALGSQLRVQLSLLVSNYPIPPPSPARAAGLASGAQL